MTSLDVVRVLGGLLMAYGGLREALALLSKPRPYSEGRYGEGSYGGGVSSRMDRLLSLAVAIRLLPKDRRLTLTDRKRDAEYLILGAMLVAGAWVVGIIAQLR